jgi:hypothetical protein
MFTLCRSAHLKKKRDIREYAAKAKHEIFEEMDRVECEKLVRVLNDRDEERRYEQEMHISRCSSVFFPNSLIDDDEIDTIESIIKHLDIFAKLPQEQMFVKLSNICLQELIKYTNDEYHLETKFFKCLYLEYIRRLHWGQLENVVYLLHGALFFGACFKNNPQSWGFESWYQYDQFVQENLFSRNERLIFVANFVTLKEEFSGRDRYYDMIVTAHERKNLDGNEFWKEVKENGAVDALIHHWRNH